METEALQIGIHGDASLPTLIYLPGIHGDWTLVSSFRERLKGKVRFVEFTYPRTLEWSLEDYASHVLDQLAANGISEGFLVGESFGSQVAWPILRRSLENPEITHFRPSMLILAGGFVRYPCMPLVDFTQALWKVMPPWAIRGFFHSYAVFARWRHRHAPETAAAIHEFVERRTPLDQQAIGHRLRLIRAADWRGVARRTELPVYQISGLIDPVVFFAPVRSWLAVNCPGYRGTCVLRGADHNVLGTAPALAAEEVWEWIKLHCGSQLR